MGSKELKDCARAVARRAFETKNEKCSRAIFASNTLTGMYEILSVFGIETHYRIWPDGVVIVTMRKGDFEIDFVFTKREFNEK